jgi:hypothetical protein
MQEIRLLEGTPWLIVVMIPVDPLDADSNAVCHYASCLLVSPTRI